MCLYKCIYPINIYWGLRCAGHHIRKLTLGNILVNWFPWDPTRGLKQRQTKDQESWLFKKYTTKGLYYWLFSTLINIFTSGKKWSCSVVCDCLRIHGLQLTRLLCPWNFPGKSTGVGCHFLLQGIFLTQGSSLGLPHCRQRLYRLIHQGSPHFW